ncbi:MAG: hypothetical protein Hyperionvirus1_34 [Hyperionvirus sp.]|uniref:Uncharacterized protein n=1 Tax=Hyperionvirus sp. TaxID=2487770 RepID=A0A3G5A5C6_9VIRU|nr:MAG: hypothetical protein Hyperionvirus1_34 [Hyperionvirus sp.]
MAEIKSDPPVPWSKPLEIARNRIGSEIFRLFKITYKSTDEQFRIINKAICDDVQIMGYTMIESIVCPDIQAFITLSNKYVSLGGVRLHLGCWYHLKITPECTCGLLPVCECWTWYCDPTIPLGHYLEGSIQITFPPYVKTILVPANVLPVIASKKHHPKNKKWKNKMNSETILSIEPTQDTSKVTTPLFS